MWAWDFIYDRTADGRPLKWLTLVDEFTRECLAIDVAGGIRSARVIEVLTQLVSVHGAPRYLRSDNFRKLVAVMELASERPEIWFDTIERRQGLERLSAGLGTAVEQKRP